MEARSAQRGGVRAPSAGSGRVGACWGPRTSPAVLMLGPPDRGGLGPAERMRRSWPRSRNSKRPLERRRWLGYWQGSWRPERRRDRDSPHCEGIMRQCGPQRGEVYRLTIMPHCANVGVWRILGDRGTEKACSDMPKEEVLRLLQSGVLKYINYWIPGLLGGFWDALPTDEAHAVCPCSEDESSGDPKEDCALGMKQWALQHGGPIDPPPDALWQELVSHHLREPWLALN